ncbi:hypothetical protein P7K49_024695 [Saguinus oedipus]|uniref:Uncharacterized protein n=1 Tax=Saguinus oedipus TaxID=9490 RepID=A0ABQ9UQ88_SAGOE|nr:hypothetical protein P7K49_024695 [Saguinus oedipus]
MKMSDEWIPAGKRAPVTAEASSRRLAKHRADTAGTDPRPLHELGSDDVLSRPHGVCEAVKKRAQHRSSTEWVRAEKGEFSSS